MEQLTIDMASRPAPEFTWWRAADGLDHAFRVVGAWMSSPCANRVRWTAALAPSNPGPSNPCRDCDLIVNGTEGEKRVADGNR